MDLVEAILKIASVDRPTNISNISELKKLTGLEDSLLKQELEKLHARGYLTVQYANNKPKRIRIHTSFPS